MPYGVKRRRVSATNPAQSARETTDSEHDPESSPRASVRGSELSALAARLAQVEAFNEQASVTIEQLVNCMLELRTQAQPEGAAPAAGGNELSAIKAKLRELEMQQNYDRMCIDLTEVSRMHAKSRSVVFVGNTYFGDNLKYAWLSCREQAEQRGFACWFMPHAPEQEKFVRSLGAPCLPQNWEQWTEEHVSTLLQAAVVVTSDHLLHPNPFALPLLAGARQLQLWHGVSIKEIGFRTALPLRQMTPHTTRVLRTAGHYAALIGTSARGEAEWRRWFGFERYAPLGYPRNDVLYREPTELDLLNVDRAAYAHAQAARDGGRRVVLWAPTFRDANRVKWILDAGLPQIARELERAGHCLIVNLHPVEQPAVPELSQAFPKVKFVSARTDIYPLLSRCDVLVTDYSSLMFDWLHLGRPIVLFRPDHEDYTQRSRKLFDDKLRSLPGPCAATAESLLKILTQPDPANTPELRAVRAELLDRWFDQKDGDAGKRFVDLVVDELDRAEPFFDRQGAKRFPS
jgi:CDP-glycerol glycerophosphotransferase